VFLSSTATDLVEYRRIADDTLLRLQQQSVVMEASVRCQARRWPNANGWRHRPTWWCVSSRTAMVTNPRRAAAASPAAKSRRRAALEPLTTPDDLGRKIATALAHARSAIATARGSTPTLPTPELRIVHALQPAPHFSGRDDVVETLSAWVDDTASPDRLHALVAALSPNA
jgi:hypothetical protein